MLIFINFLRLKIADHSLTFAKKTPISIRRHIFPFVTVFILTGAGIHYWWLTERMLIFGDSSIYLELAHNVAQGKGFRIWHEGHFIFYPFYPPLYPWLLSLSGQNVFLARITGLLSLLISAYFLCRTLLLLQISKFWTHFAVLLFLFSWLYPLHQIIITEPLFLAIFILQLWSLTKWFKTDKIPYLMLAGIFSGLMLLTRYAAMGIAGPIALWLLLAGRKRFLNFFAYLVPILFLFGPWQWTVVQSGSGLFGRQMAFHPPGKEHFKELAVTLANWLSPGLTPWLVGPVSLLLLFLVWKSRNNIRVNRYSSLLLIILAGYFLFVVAAVTWADYTTPMDNRIFSPLFIILLILLTILLNRQKPGWATSLLAVLLMLSYTVHFVWYSRSFVRGEIDVIRIHDTNIIRQLQHSPQKIYSNAIDIIKLDVPHYNRLFDLPDHYHRMTLRHNPGFDRQMERIRTEVGRGDALVVYFYGFDFRKFQARKQEILRIFMGLPIREFDDGLLIGQPVDTLNSSEVSTLDMLHE